MNFIVVIKDGDEGYSRGEGYDNSRIAGYERLVFVVTVVVVMVVVVVVVT